MKNIIGIFGVLAVLLLAVGSVHAIGGCMYGSDTGAARAAIEVGDYAAWKEAMQSFITEENFNALRERQGNFSGRGIGCAGQEECEGRLGRSGGGAMASGSPYHADMESAIEAGDYEAWREAVDKFQPVPRIAELIDADNFDRFVEMHDAMESGDVEAAKQIREELGLGPGNGGKGFSGQRTGECDGDCEGMQKLQKGSKRNFMDRVKGFFRFGR